MPLNDMQKIVALATELQQRGIPIPEDIQDALLGKKRNRKVPLTPLGYFYKSDHTVYIPNDKVKPFCSSTAVFKGLFAGRGSGKALDIQTPILTANRYWVTMGNLEVGDYVFDEQGFPTEIIATSDVMYDHKTYEVRFSDGSVIIADAEHQWTVLDKAGRKRISRYGSANYRNLTTEEMLQEGLYVYDREVNFSVDVAKPLQYRSKNILSIDPYVLGVWLGDGTSSSTSVNFGPGKEELPDLLRDCGILVQETSYDEWTFVLSNGNSGPLKDNVTGRFAKNNDSMYGLLSSMNLINNKHIPYEYLTASYYQRFALLQGLMDTDGCCNKSKCELSFTNYNLAEDAYYLLLGLGYKVNLRQGIARLNGKEFIRYRMSFVTEEPIFRLSRKLNGVLVGKSQQDRTKRRYIVDIVPMDYSVPVRCISVKSENNLYLAGTTLIPTHNSSAGAQCALQKLLVAEQNGAVINPSFENFKISTWPEFREWIPWDLVIRNQQHRQFEGWEPSGPFDMVFDLGSKRVVAHCKGIRDPNSARGPNINWLWYDEAREDADGTAWKFATAGVRIGPNPQSWVTTTPAGQDHWMYKFFVEKDIPEEAIKLILEASPGRNLVDVFFTTIFDNAANLSPEFIAAMITMYKGGWLYRQEILGEFVAGDGSIGVEAADGLKANRMTEMPTEFYKAVRFWDLAGTEKKIIKGKAVNDPDETVGSLGLDDKNTVFIVDQVAGCWNWDKVKEMILETAKKDGPGVIQVFEQEPASGGKNQVAELRSFLKAELHKAFPDEIWPVAQSLLPRELGDRVMAANTWFSKCYDTELGPVGIKVVDNGTWDCEGFIQQVSNFPIAKHDDKVTSVSGVWHILRPNKPLWKKVGFLRL